MARRILQPMPVAVGVTIIVFLMIHLMPGDPARAILGSHATPKPRGRAAPAPGGLNQPLMRQYWLFLDRLVTVTWASG